MIFNLMKPVPVADVEPDEPTATMYLYGREANKTVNCNGIIVPSLPEWDKAAYPYAVMVYDTGENLRLMVFSVPAVASETEYNYVRVYPNTDGFYCMWYGTKDNLKQLSKDVAINTPSYGMSIHDGFVVWSNHDICFEDGTIFISASDPVTTYENAEVYIGDVGYVGAVLPPLPEWDKVTYPYAVMSCEYVDYIGEILYAISLTQTPCTYDEETGYIITEKREYFLSSTFYWAKGKWSNVERYKMASDWAEREDFVWTNHDIVNADGSVHYLASDPVPVYE